MVEMISLLTLQAQLALLLGIGMLLRKIGMVDGNGRKLLTDLVINLVLPRADFVVLALPSTARPATLWTRAGCGG